MTRYLAALPLGLTLAACAGNITAPDSSTAPAEPLRKPASAVCDAEPVQGFIGEEATRTAGTAILAESGARTLRWGPPNTAWTMDYREDRVSVRYDDDMSIIAISCG